MKHPFFLSLGERIHKLPDSEWSWEMGQSLGDCGEQGYGRQLGKLCRALAVCVCLSLFTCVMCLLQKKLLSFQLFLLFMEIFKHT